MPNNSKKILLLLTLVSGTLISISSNSWLGAWMGLEINLLSFIPLMSTTKNMFTTEASLKYFLIQALGSSTLMFLIIMKMITEYNPMMINTHSSIFMLIPLLLKSGVAPLHWWFPSVMEGLNWMNCSILMTIQKIAPLMLMSYLLKMTQISMVFILMSAITGAIGGFNQISIRKILAYSSINHLSWMLIALASGKNIWLIYFSIYTIMILAIILILNNFKISFINQLMSMNHNPETKIIFLSLLLSLGGLPPFLGFLPKWIMIQSMIENDMTTLSVIMILMSLITLHYYLRICYSTFLIIYTKTKWTNWLNKNQFHTTNYMLILFTTTGLILSTMLINLF
uniref:NADH-ubiquinone oxidoreductase chain 2 n=1 Tax=Polyphaga plancyi TaxID=1804147 RepID=A0A6M9ATT3_9NEOP|nr:NADH dehydrogenase subunit 2 [Polyphaga plancyi]QKK69164.1 NADH dehydrogenase subunit 2 [Polyphaga plancyi]WGO57834.1 NADH dehydrogenase subunit 2 [Polyphaga plancyi]